MNDCCEMLQSFNLTNNYIYQTALAQADVVVDKIDCSCAGGTCVGEKSVTVELEITDLLDVYENLEHYVLIPSLPPPPVPTMEFNATALPRMDTITPLQFPITVQPIQPWNYFQLVNDETNNTYAARATAIIPCSAGIYNHRFMILRNDTVTNVTITQEHLEDKLFYYDVTVVLTETEPCELETEVDGYLHEYLLGNFTDTECSAALDEVPTVNYIDDITHNFSSLSKRMVYLLMYLLWRRTLEFTPVNRKALPNMFLETVTRFTFD